jgi:hypothetical protein
MFLFKILSDIPEYVEEQMKLCGNKIWYAKPYLYIVLFLSTLKYWHPYKLALISIAYKKYQDTVMYRERLIHFGEQFAKESFIENREDRLFIMHITRKEKMKAFLLPFNYIGRM